MQKSTPADTGLRITGIFTVFSMAFVGTHLEKMIWIIVLLSFTMLYFAILKYKTDKKAQKPTDKARSIIVMSSISALIISICTVSYFFIE